LLSCCTKSTLSTFRKGGAKKQLQAKRLQAKRLQANIPYKFFILFHYTRNYQKKPDHDSYFLVITDVTEVGLQAGALGTIPHMCFSAAVICLVLPDTFVGALVDELVDEPVEPIGPLGSLGGGRI